MRKIESKNLDTKLNSQNEWDEIIKSLEREIRLEEKLLLHEKSKQQFSTRNYEQNNKPKYSERTNKSYWSNDVSDSDPGKCHICGKDDHVVHVTNGGSKASLLLCM